MPAHWLSVGIPSCDRNDESYRDSIFHDDEFANFPWTIHCGGNPKRGTQSALAMSHPVGFLRVTVEHRQKIHANKSRQPFRAIVKDLYKATRHKNDETS